MLEVMLKLASIGLLGACISLLLREKNPEQALLVTMASAVAAFMLLAESFDQLFVYLDHLTETSKLSGEILSPLFKTVGIAILTRIGADLCQQAGARAAAGAIETGGSVLCILVAMPLLMSLLSLLEGILS